MFHCRTRFQLTCNDQPMDRTAAEGRLLERGSQVRRAFALAAAATVAACTLGCRNLTEFARPAAVPPELIELDPRKSPDAGPAQLAAPAKLAGPHQVEVYVTYALEWNQEIQAAEQRLAALRERIIQARSLEDPKLALTLLPSEVETAAGEQQSVLAANQLVPWPGKLRVRAEAAAAEAEAAEAELQAIRLRVIEQVKIAYSNLYYLQKAIAEYERELELLHQITRTAEIRYRAGAVTQQDVLLAETEALSVENELIELKQRLVSARAALAALLHVSPETQLAAANELPAEWLPKAKEHLYRQAIAARPELRAQLANIRSSERRIELARLNYRPDFTTGITWINTADHGLSPMANGKDALHLSVAINLPVYRSRLDAALREAYAQTLSASKRYQAIKDQTLREVADLFEFVKSREELLKLFRDEIIPKAEQTLQVSARAYESGRVDFQQLLDNWRRLLEYNVIAYRIETELFQGLARLERVVGGGLNRQ